MYSTVVIVHNPGLYIGLVKKFIWVNVKCYGKTQMKFLANSIL